MYQECPDTETLGHLVHVFSGEHLTQKNLRYCVNSISMNFIPADKTKTAKAVFSGGCFRGVEYYFQQTDGVVSTTVGYTGGNIDNPTYKQVCSGIIMKTKTTLILLGVAIVLGIGIFLLDKFVPSTKERQV